MYEMKDEKRKDEVILFVHGQGGNAGEADYYRPFFPESDVYGFDYQAANPWEAEPEFMAEIKRLSGKYRTIRLIATSIGAYFSMNAGIGAYVEKACFISPIVNLERLIMDKIRRAGTTEEELKRRKVIPLEFEEDLNWNYLQYVRGHKINWEVPTEILYGSRDHLQSIDTIREFAERTSAKVTVIEGAEHWIHTEEEMKLLDQWMKESV